ncbi:50S ribosomal protein L32 [Patescibacteria group bacterium]|nr:50S ribosomal protein L32 [Patescibacteria group bacterium]MCG2687315.1 50S ribosomal protein L32 [Candidatus Parcubacteria bacterium]
MPVPAFRNSRTRVRKRRSHHALKKTDVSVCPNCQAVVLPHITCAKCGQYKGRQVLGGIKEVEKTIEKKVVKKKKETTKE